MKTKKPKRRAKRLTAAQRRAEEQSRQAFAVENARRIGEEVGRSEALLIADTKVQRDRARAFVMFARTIPQDRAMAMYSAPASHFRSIAEVLRSAGIHEE